MLGDLTLGRVNKGFLEEVRFQVEIDLSVHKCNKILTVIVVVGGIMVDFSLYTYTFSKLFPKSIRHFL